ncbi:LLM class flavin-dependent oxidoreductase [Actinomyces sp. oral taxon 171]|uniref:LLM class flavin-dependent oxidoreductase n=1 Tax=Actinomyces sp. oral taxon 171 TaxID=706438 RepID=UPI0001F6298D|nr:LLM class flavin-dependent oxidoreductase [Actinomyces sp. oral taxon 171]EFW28073.1 luciferase family oxidoreductase, FMN-dependent, PP_0088 family [Actinomyces sp. oral taxon 171 str. F0337]QCT33895.1 LLM class flavin-dependent oxidoreductase [Actinomyces sp. oral taxon 171 str. F0337]
MSQPERRAVPVLSVMDMVPVSAGCSRTDALTEMIALARAADAAGYERYWLAEHHGSATYLSSATIVLMGQVLAATERLGVASGGIMLPNHAPLVVAEQIGTLATLYPGRVDLGLGRAPGTDRRTAAALRRGASDPGRFAEEILEILTYLGDEPVPEQVPGSLLLGAPGVLDDAVQVSEPDGPRVRAIPGEGTHPNVWVLGSSVNGARVAGRLGLPFAVASHFAPVQAEAAIATYRSVLESRTEGAPGLQGAPDAPRVAAAVNVMVAPSHEEARLLFSTAMAAAARIVGNRPGPLDPPSEDPQAWRAYAPGREDAVEAAMSLSFVGTADDVAARLREQAARWDLDEVLVVTHAHDPALRRRSYELLAQAWNA